MVLTPKMAALSHDGKPRIRLKQGLNKRLFLTGGPSPRSLLPCHLISLIRWANIFSLIKKCNMGNVCTKLTYP